jgi:hypothetical protein
MSEETLRKQTITNHTRRELYFMAAWCFLSGAYLTVGILSAFNQNTPLAFINAFGFMICAGMAKRRIDGMVRA